MFKAEITFKAFGKDENEALEAILFDIHEELRIDGEHILIEDIGDKDE